ncbi:hypothetical protein XPA_003713 [Xanthoria parietina]
MAAGLLRTASSIQQGPVRAAASNIKGLSTTRGSREPVALPRPLIFESYYNFFYARSRPRPNLRFIASVKAFQSIRGYALTSSYRQPATKPGPPAEASKDSRGADNSNNSQNSTVDPNETTLPQTATAAVQFIREEIAWIKGCHRDPNVQLKPEARARNKARLSALQQYYRHWAAKVEWWEAIYDKEPREIKEASDVYQRVQIVRAALETDAESKEPVWTAQERTTLEAHLGKWEADVRKADRWYKKIAWGPSIIGTAILNMILP